MKLKPALIVCLSSLMYFGCKTISYSGNTFKKHKTLKIIKSDLDLNKIEFEQIIKNDTIVIETYNAIMSSVKKEKIKTHLNAFLAKKYESKKLILALKMEQYVIRTGGAFEFNDSINPNNAYHVNSIEEFDSLRKIIFKRFRNKVKIKTDSLKTKKL